MPKKKPEPRYFSTVTDMRALPAEKIDHFIEDLRLWLHMHKQIEQVKAQLGPLSDAIKITSLTDAFGWVDDGRHDANINLHIQPLESAKAADAVDPESR